LDISLFCIHFFSFMFKRYINDLKDIARFKNLIV